MARPRKRAAPPDARPARNEAPGHHDQPARKHPTRTPQNPFEQADQRQDPDDEVTYKVEKVKSMRFLKGVRQYLVAWEGYGEGDDTWEPMANLVGCAAEIKAYEVARAAQDVLDIEEELLARRKAAKDKAQQNAEELRQQAREQAMREAGEEPVAINVDEAELAVTANGVLKIHKNKSGVVWSCFDLTVVKPIPASAWRILVTLT
ncbi:hypothetical protein AB1Y20_014558 [Prymnesium parvum]|uniref:Chromo domain-containing protein n=1 Tax=Prymnesium parvum TaxID=97485 RepID=A0AB34IAW1_PRYPA